MGSTLVRPGYQVMRFTTIFKKVDLPLPTAPTIIVILDSWMLMFRPFSTGSVFSTSFNHAAYCSQSPWITFGTIRKILLVHRHGIDQKSRLATANSPNNHCDLGLLDVNVQAFQYRLSINCFNHAAYCSQSPWITFGTIRKILLVHRHGIDPGTGLELHTTRICCPPLRREPETPTFV
jgi:hypothetical protein